MSTVVEQSSIWRRAGHALGIGTWGLDRRGRVRRGAWMQTFSGEMAWPLDPRADEIHFDDVCVGGARECRFGNHSRDYYSVNEHQVLVSIYAERIALERGASLGEAHEVGCEGLLHDFPEAYLGDIPRPIKTQRVMRGYRKIEDRWWRAGCERFGLRPTRETKAIVKEADRRVLIDEIEALMLDPQMWWDDGRYEDVEGFGADIAAFSPDASCHFFAQRFCEMFPNDPEVERAMEYVVGPRGDGPRKFSCFECEREHDASDDAVLCCEVLS